MVNGIFTGQTFNSVILNVFIFTILCNERVYCSPDNFSWIIYFEIIFSVCLMQSGEILLENFWMNNLAKSYPVKLLDTFWIVLCCKATE